MNNTMKLVTAISVFLVFAISAAVVHYQIQVPYIKSEQFLPLKNALMTYLFFLLFSFMENREQYQKNNMMVVSMFIPLLVAFVSFRGESLVPVVYENLGYSTVFIVAILLDILRKPSLEEEIAKNKERNK